MIVSALVFALAVTAADPAPAAATPVVTLVINGASAAVDDKEWSALAHVNARGTEKDGSEHVFAGVALDVLLAKHGVPLGGDVLKGKLLAGVIIVEGEDGYRVAFGIGDVDSATSGRTMILANQRDGAAHPLQLVIPGDKRHARWCRQVVRISYTP
ncbi:MAG TPA: hypothetical protein VGO62_00470 [Myxococcota bacterium]